MSKNTSPIPITILTGFLGAGKTTLLLSLLPQLPAGYKLCLLKNEFGDVAVDSQLAAQGSIAGVTELLNGCICCNLVGQLSDALISLKNSYKPTRIVIETSGSAFPATLAMEVNRISRENGGIFTLDGVIQVIDVENFSGYADTSYTAKLQANYTDLIILNKCEVAGTAQVDEVMDRIRDVAEETPIVKADQGWIDKDIVFGVDASFARQFSGEGIMEHDHDHSSEVDVLSLTLPNCEDAAGGYVDAAVLERLLTTAPKDEVYRIKGILRFRASPPQHPDTPGDGKETPATPPAGNRWVLNWAFGRWRFTSLRESSVVTTIKGSEDPPAPVEFAPSNAECEEADDEAKPISPEGRKLRKGSIEVLVQTSIKTVVEDHAVEVGDCARLSFVLARGEGRRWLGRLQREGWVKYDRPEVQANVRIESIV
ncbi:CobW/HypB/UreG, nucleotide-binding domain-containing protein [Trichophaea hybrida]|nr:CobW/HypB/UreG, nucleotide-binding domain-containing protein [Trichophaea hybrida]